MEIKISEKDFEGQIRDLAKLFNWKYYHTWRSIHSPAGFPDCVMVRPPRLLFAELKREGKDPTPAQQEWLDILRQCAPILDIIPIPEVYLWRPSDLEQIVEVLK